MDPNSEKIAHNIISKIESHIDDEIHKLDQLDGRGLEELREQRLQELKREAELKNEWRSKVKE